jgi:hypothetical protein
MRGPGSEDLPSRDPASGSPAGGGEAWRGAHGATASAQAASPPGVPSRDRVERRRGLVAGLIGALIFTVLSLIFATSFIGALHNTGPRSVPFGVVGPPAAAARFGSALNHAVPGGFVVKSYPNQAAALRSINNRTIDAALVPGPAAQHLLVAQAVSSSLTNTLIKGATTAAAKARVPLTITNVRPLHASDPEGLSQTFFVIAILAPSFLFGNQLIRRIAPTLGSHWHLALIVVYAPIVAAAAVALADAGIGALTGAPWALFGIGTLLAFAVAVMGAAAARWAGAIGVAVIALLFIPIGIASSGVTIGPNMITPWYADIGKALPPGSALPAVLNTTYFGGNAITTPLLVLSAWALAGIIAMVLAAILHPPIPGERTKSGPADAARQGHAAARHRATAS